jgi:predicted RNA methylase
MDVFFTPPELVATMVGAVRLRSVKTIADFAAGHGALLLGAAKRWPAAAMIAADIMPGSVRALSRMPSCRASRCDFLSHRSRAHAWALADAQGRVDLVLLNPPFSFRGGAHERVVLQGRPLRCSRPLAFVLNAMVFLRSGGELIALLPAGSVSSQKDESAWKALAEIGTISVLGYQKRGSFPNCAASTAIVRVVKSHKIRRHRASRRAVAVSAAQRVSVTLLRGTTPMFSLRPGDANGMALVHTTDLGGPLNGNLRRTVRGGRSLCGPAVLLPRVGNPSLRKLHLHLDATQALLLSDCVFALCCASAADARLVESIVRSNWSAVAGAYKGTCAPYLTIEGLKVALRRMGIGTDAAKLAQ